MARDRVDTDGDAFVLTGRKRWITFGTLSDLFKPGSEAALTYPPRPRRDRHRIARRDGAYCMAVDSAVPISFAHREAPRGRG